MADIARITEVVEPEVKALGFDLVRVIVFGKSEVGDEEGEANVLWGTGNLHYFGGDQRAGADEFEAFDEFVDGLDEDGIDAAAPVLAGMVIRRALPGVARAAAPVRRAAVRAVSQAVRVVTSSAPCSVWNQPASPM